MLKDEVFSNSAHTADDDLKESIQYAVSSLSPAELWCAARL